MLLQEGRIYGYSTQTLRCDHRNRHLQVRAVDALAALVESNLLSADKRLLQPGADLHSLDSILELQRNWCVVQARGCELVGLLDETRLETTPVIGGYLPGNASLGVVVDEVLLGVKVDGELALGADDLGNIFLAVGHHARGVVVGDPAVPELDDADGVIVVLVLLETWENGDNTVCGDGFGYHIGTEVPQGQVNVVHGHVDEYTARPCSILNEEV